MQVVQYPEYPFDLYGPPSYPVPLQFVQVPNGIDQDVQELIEDEQVFRWIFSENIVRYLVQRHNIIFYKLMVIFSEMFDDLEIEDTIVEGEMEFQNTGQNETAESRRVADRNSGSKSKKLPKIVVDY